MCMAISGSFCPPLSVAIFQNSHYSKPIRAPWLCYWQVLCVRCNGTIGYINEVALCQARLVLAWVTVHSSTPGAGSLSQSNQPSRSTQPGHPSMGQCNEYQPVDSDYLRLGVTAGVPCG